jgi:hypothetical protein
METVNGQLPGGLVDEPGTVHKHFEVAALSGREEMLLPDGKEAACHTQVTALLSRCVRRIGAFSPVSQDNLRRLPVADRQYLLLKVREATCGTEVRVTLTCRSDDCGKRMDVDFSTQDIPVKASIHKGPLYKVQLSPEARVVGEDGRQYEDVVFRLPCGADQEEIGSMLERDEQRAAAMLLGRCVQRIGSWEHPGLIGISRLPARTLMEIEKQIEQAAPAVELMMAGNCPHCGARFSLPFDLVTFFWDELQNSREQLLREVHYLAFHYHWSEQEIMAMPRPLRRRYVTLLAQEMEKLYGDR